MSTEALYKLLAAAATITAKIEGRLYYDELPQGEYGPAIVLQRGSESRELIHRKPSGLVKGFAYINCFAPGYLEAGDLAELVRLAVDGFSGTVALAGSDHDVAYITLEDASDIATHSPDGKDQSPVHGVRLDARYAYHETAPNLIGA